MWYEKLYAQVPIKFLIRINLSLFFRFRGKFCLNNNMPNWPGLRRWVQQLLLQGRGTIIIHSSLLYLFIFLYLTINNQIIKIFNSVREKCGIYIGSFFLFGWDKWVNDGGIDHLIWWRGSMIGNATCHLPFSFFFFQLDNVNRVELKFHAWRTLSFSTFACTDEWPHEKPVSQIFCRKRAKKKEIKSKLNRTKLKK